MCFKNSSCEVWLDNLPWLFQRAPETSVVSLLKLDIYRNKFECLVLLLE